tara:strand:- start:13340 stop:13771 length:432 start_codon:yes stop_codon:yes gene_type:complete
MINEKIKNREEEEEEEESYLFLLEHVPIISSSTFIDSGRVPSSIRDDGCELYAECLSCPLPRCKYDESLTTQLRRMRDAKILQLYFDDEVDISIIYYDYRKIGISRHIVKHVITKEKNYRLQHGQESNFRDYLVNISEVKYGS